ncbi:hypothetical protein ACHAC9_22220 [Massilia sp. CMS3.1]|uniref:hypothetical protein n=1 Tax=Massilia sp. CMS3.1 TaxID=3373083 RepID=UPI003EE59895
MTKIILLAALLTGSAHATSAVATDPITVFGLTLGAKLKTPFRQCSMKEIGTDVRSLCWISPPSMHKGWRTGSIQVPGADSRPAWAVNGSFNASVAKDGTLGELEIRTYPADKFQEIMRSIGLRFGPATKFTPLPASKVLSASWSRPDIKIELMCGPKIDCYTTITSPKRVIELARERDAQREKEASRPLSM